MAATSSFLKLHRSRLVDWTPASISAIAPSIDGRAVAVGREDGEIELYNVSEDWHCVLRIPGEEGSALTSLVWCAATSDAFGDDGMPSATAGALSLVSAGLSGNLIEYDLLNLRARSTTPSMGGPVWSLAVQPPAANAPQARPCRPASLFQPYIAPSKMFTHLYRFVPARFAAAGNSMR